jgi:hypothetical protein
MAASNMAGGFQIQTLPIIGGFNRQRFRQFGPEDSAGWYVKKGLNTKRPYSLYPQLGRAHIKFLGSNQLIFATEPRGEFKSIQYAYIVDGNSIFRVDNQFNRLAISNISNASGTIPTTGILTNSGPIYFTFLVVGSIVFACFVDSEGIYIYREDTGIFYIVTDPNAPKLPGYIAAFGNRITVSNADSSQFNLSQVNLGGSNFDPATCFTIAGAAVFAQEDGIIRQMGVLNNTLYIFTDYVTGVWSNIPAVFSGTGVTFPWKKNSTYNWNFGIANPTSLDIDFGMLVFLARNSDGLLQFMMSSGGQPERISDAAIDTLLQRYTNLYGQNNPFLSANSNGFLYQYENNIFYRMSGGNYYGYGILDQEQNANSIEFSFENKEWNRCVELNGERNRVQFHVYFNFMHLVTLVGDSTVYNMSGQYYYNEIRNPNQSNPQAMDAYIAYPFRYERVTPIISQDDYSEFETEYVEIDFVFGDSNINYSTAPFSNTTFIIDEELDPVTGQIQYLIDQDIGPENEPVYIIADGTNSDSPAVGELTYNALFKPSIELFYSDDAGISYNSADVRQFSQMGVYQWKMRWYQLGPSRNRVYKLVCVSPVPIVILGGVMNVRRISGGAN